MYPSIFSISFEWQPIILFISSEEKELRPLANSLFLVSRIFIWSPLLNFPDKLIIPAANKLLPPTSAFLAPSSMTRVPFGETELIIHFFLACNLDILDSNKVQIFFFSICCIGFKYNPLQ